MRADEVPSPAPLAPLPATWSSMAGNGGPEAMPGTCEIGIDSQKSTAGQQVYSVRCANQTHPGYGGARKHHQDGAVRGKRVRVSAWVMAAGIEGVSTPQYLGVVGEAGLWIGVGSPKNGLRMDRMQNRNRQGIHGLGASRLRHRRAGGQQPDVRGLLDAGQGPDVGARFQHRGSAEYRRGEFPGR